MSNKTIFGLPVDILSASNMTVTSSAPDGKYVLKAGDSMSGDLKMEGGADIAIQDGGELSVDGKTRLYGNATCYGEMLVDNNLSVSGTGMFNGNLTANAGGYVAGLLEAPGGATIGDELEATGKSHFYGDVTMDTKLDAKGDVLLESKLDVKGRATFDDVVEAQDELQVHGEVYVQQNAYITGRLQVTGPISSFQEAKVTGLVSAEPPIDVDALSADPKVAVDVVASVSTDPVTVLTDVKQDTISSAPSTSGWSFTVGSSPITVTHLLYVAPGMTTPRDVGIWELDTATLLVQATVSETDPLDPMGNWRIHALDEKDYVTLDAETKYVIGGFYPTTSVYSYINPSIEIDSNFFSDGPWGRYKLSTPSGLEMPDTPVAAHILYNCNFYFKTQANTSQVLYSGISRLPLHPTMCVSRSTAQSIPNDTNTTITWDTVKWASNARAGDNKMGWDHNGAFIVVPVNGIYLLSYTVTWATPASVVGHRTSQVWVNSSSSNAWAAKRSISTSSATTQTFTVTDHVALSAGDTVQVTVRQNSGSPMNCAGSSTDHFAVTLLYGL